MRRFIPCTLAIATLGCPSPEPQPPALDAGGSTDAAPDRSDALVTRDAASDGSDTSDAPDASTPEAYPLDGWAWPQPSFPTREGAFWSRHPRVGVDVSAWVGRAEGLEREALDLSLIHI